MRKKIAIFLPTLNGGGAERAMVTLANAIAAQGYSVDFVLATCTGIYLKDISPAVNIVNLNSGRVIKSLIPLARYLHRVRPQAMLSALGHANVVAMLARYISRTSVRVVVSERGLISGEYAIAKGAIAHINYWLIRLLYSRAYGICTVSQAASKDLAEFVHLPLTRVKTIYNPFDLSRIEKLASEPLIHPWFETNQPPVVMAIGRMNEAKDFPVLIRAFAQLRQTRMARLIILGEGELRPELQRLLLELSLDEETVQMPGFVPNPYAWLSRCSVFVLSSRREGLPGALIEAMACGTPVVSTNCLSGPDEILERGRWGQLVPVGDIYALAEAIAMTLDTPKVNLPNVRLRAADFQQERAVEEYLNILGISAAAMTQVAKF